MKFKSTLPLLLLMIGLCASSVRSQITYPRGSMTSPTTVAALPATGNSNLLYDVRDGNPDCSTGGGSTRIVCHWTGAAYEKVAAGSVLAASNFVSGLTSTATAAGTTTLTVASKYFQVFTGSTTQTVTLPVVTTLPQVGFSFAILNDSSGALTVNSSGGNLVQTVAAGARVTVTCKLLTGTTAASWDVAYLPATFGISNSAGANVVPKSDGTNLVAGRATDAGSGDQYLIEVDTGSFDVTTTGATSGFSVGGSTATITAATAINLDSKGGVTTIGDVGGTGNSTKITIDDGTQEVSVSSGVPFITLGNGRVTSGGGFWLGQLGKDIASTGVPAASVFVGNAANNSSQITGTFTRDNVTTLQDITQTLIGRAASVDVSSSPAASIGATNIQVNGGIAPSGLYRLTYHLQVSVAGTSGTCTTTIGWTDTAARTSVSGAITFGTLAAAVTGSLIIKADGATQITYLTTVTAAVGSPEYTLRISLERLQ